jgi:branched-chain amino acid transport system permease protein
MSQALQQLINGLTLGAIYGLIAIGYTMVYGIIGMINFAHGDIYMVSAFIAVTCFTLLASGGISSVVASIAITLIVSIVLTSVFGWTVERVGYRPLRGSNRLAPLISSIGISIFLQNMVQLTQGQVDPASCNGRRESFRRGGIARRTVCLVRPAPHCHRDHRPDVRVHVVHQ